MERVLGLTGLIFTLIGGLFAVLGAALLLGTQMMAMGLFLLIGLVFLTLGIVFLARVARGKKRRARLLESGERINADLVDVSFDTVFTYNGRCPLVLRCQAVNPEDGLVYAFVSEGLWFDPTPFLKDVTSVPVCVDPSNWSRYAMDTSGILPRQGGRAGMWN